MLPFVESLRHHVSYYSDWSPWGYGAGLADVLVIGVGVYLVLTAVERATTKGSRLTAQAGAILVVLISLNQLRRHVLPIAGTELWARIAPAAAGFFPVLRLLAAAAVLAVLWLLRRRAEAVFRICCAMVLALSPFAVWNVGRALVEVGTGSTPATFSSRSFVREANVPAADTTLPRVVIALFDMTDYGLAFARRPGDLQLPNFDAVRAEGLFATNARSPRDGTVRSIPSLLDGVRVDSVRALGPARLELLRGSMPPEVWGERTTLVSAAAAQGIPMSVVGWYLPYCATFAATLESCWSAPVGGSRTPFERAIDEARAAMSLPLSDDAIHSWAAAHLRLLQAQRAEALRVLADGRARLVFLHFAVPHWPWLFDRAQHHVRLFAPDRADGYADNLALADSILGDVRRALAGDARTTLIVTADHPYFPPPWGPASPLLAVHDPRVPFIVRLPGRGGHLEYDRALNTILLPTLALRLAEAHVRTIDSLRRWLDAAVVAEADSAVAFRSYPLSAMRR